MGQEAPRMDGYRVPVPRTPVPCDPAPPFEGLSPCALTPAT